MTSQNNKRAQVRKLEDAIERLTVAAQQLGELKREAKDAGDWGMVGSLSEYEKQILEAISCDNGETGLEALLDAIVQGRSE